MTVDSLSQLSAAVHGRAAQADPKEQIRSAARQFESVLLTQLLQTLWKTSPELSKGQGAMYQSMFQGAFAEHLAEGGGIGLADMISSGLGVSAKSSAGMTRHIVSEGLPLAQRSLNLNPDIAQSAQDGDVLANVNAAASGMLSGGGKQWAKDASLSTADLASVNAGAAGNSARQTVLSTHGYQGYYKCNLFAFELARRAGLDVPRDASGTRLDFPSSNNLTQDASDGSVDAGWAKVATGASPAAMQDALRSGEAAFMLVGQGHGGAHGHMAMMQTPRSIDYDAKGQVRSITFDGWEAQPDGAKHLTQRTWNRTDHSGGPHDRNGLDRIEIIQLNRKAADPAPSTNTQGDPPTARNGLK
jgi:Rod binding domain-containing protein